MKHLQTIIISVVVTMASLLWYQHGKLKIEKDMVAMMLELASLSVSNNAALASRIDLSYRVCSDLMVDMVKHSQRLTALENRPAQVVQLPATPWFRNEPVPPGGWSVPNSTVYVTNGMITHPTLGTPVRPSLEEQRVIEETLK